jgi:hypothetical protein
MLVIILKWIRGHASAFQQKPRKQAKQPKPVEASAGVRKFAPLPKNQKSEQRATHSKGGPDGAKQVPGALNPLHRAGEMGAFLAQRRAIDLAFPDQGGLDPADSV